ncbi:glycosyltransferase family 2 protein [Pseudonocardia parietis]|uniref:GT2 family glycosyltransferase n=1 Tax=Pseudonocardia parietis TaxID=570936 RepID=A0ABS4VZP4_9PSEU|nr:glycosyltransferase [Pseudonocardia parietis]MBP2369421.1 GT2 family glycosyltransferase [Pseudonocardia parietis]
MPGREPATDLQVPERFGTARLLVTDTGVPVGQVDVALRRGRATADELARAAATVAGAEPPASPPTSAEPMTVVVATRGRPESVRRCVAAILAGDHPDLTVLVVDNDPPDGRTRAVVEEFGGDGVYYVREPRRGASVGRNRGLAEARTPVVAFTDDDTEPDPGWASRIAGAFAADPQLTGLSGPVLAARLETAQERAADVALAWNKGFVQRRFRLDDPPSDAPVFPFSPGLFGIGANLAVRTGRVRELGGFDEALGPGRPTRGGEDIELLVRIVLGGGTLAYLPAAYVWHHHRPSDEELRDQLAGYALGLGAFLGKVAMDPRARRLAMRRFPAAVARLREIVRRESAGRPGEGAPRSRPGEVAQAPEVAARRHQETVALPGGAATRKVRGLASGTVLYLRTRQQVRAEGGVCPPLTRPRPTL